MRMDEEADEFRRQFTGIRERTLPEDATFAEALVRRSLGSAAELVTAARLTISEDPAIAAAELARIGAECAVCGVLLSSSERVAATLHVHLSGGGGLGLGVWVHTACLARCEQTEQRRGIPW